MLKHNTAFKQVLRGTENRRPLVVCLPRLYKHLVAASERQIVQPARKRHTSSCTWDISGHLLESLHWDCVLLFSVCTVIGLYSAGGTVGGVREQKLCINNCAKVLEGVTSGAL